MNEVQSGKIELTGKYLEGHQGDPTTTLTTKMTPQQAADFRAFDITCDGLRFGQEILWFPLEYDKEFTLEIPVRSEHFEEVSVNEDQLKTALRAGTSPAVSGPRLPNARLKDWCGNLSTDEKQLPADVLHKKCVADHPRNHVSRRRIRDIVGPRSQGRPKKKSP
jgi:hypothetical protein